LFDRPNCDFGSSVDTDVVSAVIVRGVFLGHEIAVVLLCPAVRTRVTGGDHQMRRAMWHVADRTRGRPAMELLAASVVTAGESVADLRGGPRGHGPPQDARGGI